MTRIKKSRKPKAIVSQAKEPKAIKDKKPKKRVGKKPGSRQQEGMKKKAVEVSSNQTKDRRVGSKKPIPLTDNPTVVTIQHKKHTQSAPLAKVRVVDEMAELRQELAEIEQDQQLLTIVDKQDLGQAITVEEQAYYQQKMARYQQIQQQLGIDEDDNVASELNNTTQAHSEDELWDKFDSEDLSRFDQFED